MGRVQDADKLSCNQSLTRDRTVDYHPSGAGAILNFLGDPVALKVINSALDTPRHANTQLDVRCISRDLRVEGNDSRVIAGFLLN